ncbi:aldehyde reductase [Favolaschia claudopus]|uniref:Aldehyde reductase n=1 Tax=Favolaschia claudopus TaxID=2862362 RepID=A0AAW0DCU9_9AGAR
MSSYFVKPIFGGFPFGLSDGKTFRDVESTEKVYKLLEEAGCDTIDTARVYGDSEEWLGKTGAGERFTLDTKTPGGFYPGSSTGDGILQHAKESIGLLGVKRVDVFYIHAPDASVDLEDQLRGINQAYKAGYFKRFGLSNFKAKDVQLVYEICKVKGYPLPTVYQGNYNAVTRKLETEIVPTVRKLGMALYVYSPMAGGLLTRTSEQLREGSQAAGRYAQGHAYEAMYRGVYNTPNYLKALDLWGEAASLAGCSRGELAYRWVAFDSVVDPKHGDAILFGASKHSQVTETLKWLKAGSVGEAAKAKIEEIWKLIEREAPLDNFHSTQ